MKRTYLYIPALMAMALTSCTDSDSPKPAGPVSTDIMISTGDADIGIWQPVSTSRAGELPAPENDVINSVGVFSSNDADEELVFNNMQFYNSLSPAYEGDALVEGLKQDWPAGNHWVYTPKKTWQTNAYYNFVGYSPYSAGAAKVVRNENGEITELIWEGLSSISAFDCLVSTCVGYTALSSDNEAVPLHLTHLMARLRFCFQLDEEYAKLRTIVVKEMKVNYADSRSMTLAVSYAKSDAVYEPTYRWQREEAGTGATSVTLHNEGDLESITLTKDQDYQPLASLYYEPGDPLNIFNIRVTYDVYDSTGALLRANDSAESAITMLRTVEAGKYYDVKIRIKPSYLYVLSDQEPDSDGELIIP